MKPDSKLSPELLLANGFAEHVVAWAIERNAPPEALDLLRRVASMVSTATSEGHVCVMLGDILADHSSDEPGMRHQLLASGVVGTPDAPQMMPLVLDGDGRIYLHRYFDYERRLAHRLVASRSTDFTVDIKVMRSRLDELFETPSKHKRVDWQKIAAALALQQPLTIISGGPGTGKTTTVVNLLACLLEQNPDCRIALAAPTGKAAARMQEAIRQRAEHLPVQLQEKLPSESFTIHRLLGVMPFDGGFRHHTDNPLPIDALIVDEASMLDIALAARLIDAVPLHARIILLGDMDQLSAVEAGSVFSELSADPSLTPDCIDRLSDLTGMAAERIAPAPPRTPSTLHNSVIWFSENYRFSNDSGISKLAGQINAGNADEALALLHSANDPSITWLRDGDKTLSAASLAHMYSGYEAYRQIVQSNSGNKQAIFDAFDRFRILCAVREGARGVDEINRKISSHFHPDEQIEWFPGRPVIVLRNDYLLKLFNGDVGIALPDESNEGNDLMVYFPDSEGQFRAIAPARLPEHETAFAMTVHKSQGSEFESILLLLPGKHNRVLSRELLYTAITRARSKIEIISNEDVLTKTIDSPTRRNSGLIRRIEEASRN